MTTDTITQIPVEQLTESPFNPRKTFTAIDELVANIQAEGRIHSPLLVRPLTPNPLRDDIVDGYQVVFGHRRLRAAEAAGLATVPCMVRAMTDAQARRAQVAENLARTDVHPIEEAEGFQLMIEQDGITADELAITTGKSRSYVYGRLKLLQACAEIRQACMAGEIGSEVALLIARLRTEKLQAKALAAIRADSSQHSRLDDGGKRSFRHIRDLLAEKFTLALKSAIFAREDADLLPGAGACSACPKRTGNAPEFDDLATPQREGAYGSHHTRASGADTCTDPDCFDAKKQAHLAQEAALLKSRGADVITGNKARAAVSATGDVKGDYIALDDVKKLLKAKPKTVDLAVVSIQNPRDGKVKKAVKRADLVAAGLLKADQAKAPSHAENYKAQDQKRRDEQAKANAKAAALTRQHMALLQRVRQDIAARELGAFELRLMTAAAVVSVPWADREVLMELQEVDDYEELLASIDSMEPAALKALLMDCALVNGVRIESYSLNGRPAPLLALAEHYGIDAEAVMQASAPPPAVPSESASTPSPAGAGAKKAGARAKRAKVPACKYVDMATGQTWTGRGLKPAWVRAALAQGKTLDNFLTLKPKAEVQKVKDDAGSAGERADDTAIKAACEAH